MTSTANPMMDLVKANMMMNSKDSPLWTFMILTVLEFLMKYVSILMDFVKKYGEQWFDRKFKNRLENLPMLNGNGLLITENEIIFIRKYDGKSRPEAFLTVDAVLSNILKVEKIKKMMYSNATYMINYKDVVEVDQEIKFQLMNTEFDADGEIALIRFRLFTDKTNIQNLKKFVNDCEREYEILKKNKLGNDLFFFDHIIPPSSKKDGLNSAPMIHSDRVVFTRNLFITNRTLDNVFFEQKKEVATRLNIFVNHKGWYDRRGIPHTLGFLLHGSPGTGKTSCIKSVANMTKRHIINVNLGKISKKSHLKQLFYDEKIWVIEKGDMGEKVESYIIPINKRLYVMEDIDATEQSVLFKRNMAFIEEEKRRLSGTVGTDDHLGNDDHLPLVMTQKEFEAKSVATAEPEVITMENGTGLSNGDLVADMPIKKIVTSGSSDDYTSDDYTSDEKSNEKSDEKSDQNSEEKSDQTSNRGLLAQLELQLDEEDDADDVLVQSPIEDDFVKVSGAKLTDLKTKMDSFSVKLGGLTKTLLSGGPDKDQSVFESRSDLDGIPPEVSFLGPKKSDLIGPNAFETKVAPDLNTNLMVNQVPEKSDPQIDGAMNGRIKLASGEFSGDPFSQVMGSLGGTRSLGDRTRPVEDFENDNEQSPYVTRSAGGRSQKGKDGKGEKDGDSDEEDGESVDLSCILNILDGTLETPGRIIIITSNYPEKLDHALIRPGRIDLILEFKKANRGVISEMYECFFDGAVPDPTAINMIADYKWSPAEVSQIMFKNYDQPDQALSDLACKDPREYFKFSHFQRS